MKPPSLVTAPASPIVSIFDMKAHLRVTHDLENDLITGYIGAATAYLDGWKGVLGRAVVSQTWREDFDGFGDLRLSLPDVASVVVTAADADGGAVAVDEATLKQDLCGHYVEASGGSAATVSVQYVAGMPAQQLALAAMVVKLLVAHWYTNREAVGAAMVEVPMGAQTMIDAVRWNRT